MFSFLVVEVVMLGGQGGVNIAGLVLMPAEAVLLVVLEVGVTSMKAVLSLSPLPPTVMGGGDILELSLFFFFLRGCTGGSMFSSSSSCTELSG